jgi:hypothetical protein
MNRRVFYRETWMIFLLIILNNWIWQSSTQQPDSDNVNNATYTAHTRLLQFHQLRGYKDTNDIKTTATIGSTASFTKVVRSTAKATKKSEHSTMLGFGRQQKQEELWLTSQKDYNDMPKQNLSNWTRSNNRFRSLLLLGFRPRRRRRGNYSQYGTCDGCFCVPSPTNQTCPMESIPRIRYSNRFVRTLQRFHWNNTLTLSCDPYNNNIDCDTNEYSIKTPPIHGNILSNTTADTCCVIDFFHQNHTATKIFFNVTTIHGNKSNYIQSLAIAYNIRTYDGIIKQALSDGLYVTHAGHCGLCSNLHDLSVYMNWGTNLRSQSEWCGFIGLLGKQYGVHCFHKRIGFTIGCSTIWYYNTVNTRRFCNCWQFAIFDNVPTNGPAPSCSLNSCLECDEYQSGPIFQQYAGRTRRNSAILTDLVRNCSDIARLIQVDPRQYIGATS